MSMSRSGEKKLTWQTADPDDCYGLATPASRPSDTVLLDYASACYESADLSNGVVLHIVLPPNSKVTGDLRADLTAARRASQDR